LYNSALIVEHTNSFGNVLDVHHTPNYSEAEFYFAKFYARRYVECNGSRGDGVVHIRDGCMGYMCINYPDGSVLNMRYDSTLVDVIDTIWGEYHVAA
jgi:hypothetical protein